VSVFGPLFSLSVLDDGAEFSAVSFRTVFSAMPNVLAIARLLAAGCNCLIRVALLFPQPEKGDRGKKGKAEETSGFSQKRLREARQVLAYSRELAQRGRGKKDAARKEAETASFSYRRVKQARQVLAYSRELAIARCHGNGATACTLPASWRDTAPLGSVIASSS
jgi:hypothetical protein